MYMWGICTYFICKDTWTYIHVCIWIGTVFEVVFIMSSIPPAELSTNWMLRNQPQYQFSKCQVMRNLPEERATHFWRHARASGRWVGRPAPQGIPRSCWLLWNLALFPFKVLITELTSKVPLDSPCSYLQVKHLFTTDERGLKPASAVSSGNKSFLFSLFPQLSRQHTWLVSCWRTCQPSWTARRALGGCWASPPWPARGGCRCSPPAPGCGCPSSAGAPCASPAPAGPPRRSGCGTLQWHQKGCCPRTGESPAL